MITLKIYFLFYHCSQGHNRTRDLDNEDLLEHLPALQQLLYRLVGCQVLCDSVEFLTISGIYSNCTISCVLLLKFAFFLWTFLKQFLPSLVCCHGVVIDLITFKPLFSTRGSSCWQLCHSICLVIGKF